MEKIQTTVLARDFIRMAVKPGGLAVDATMGRGQDTEYLCRLTGTNGKVLAFDIQEEALFSTEMRLREAGLLDSAKLILRSHEWMDTYTGEGSVDGIMFNLGYLPGGNHHIRTKAETSIRAIQKGLMLLKEGGRMSLCIYYGGDTGYEEKEAVLAYLGKLPYQRFTVVVTELYNRPKNPPIFAGVVKEV